MKKISLTVSLLIIVLSMCSCGLVTTIRVDDGDRTPVVSFETSAAPETVSVPETTDAVTTDYVPRDGYEGAFENCLFVGDSRTVGLRDAADLTGADVFASVGLNVFRVNEDAIEIEGLGEVRLTDLLSSNNYDKIYIMLGINEIGYNLDYVIREFGKAVDTIKEAQPNATVYIMANLHIVKTRSDSDEIYTNDNLNYLNEGMKSFADNNQVKYLDVNPIFDDEYGCLNQEYAFDDFHLYSEHYPTWAQWIADNSK